MLTRKPSMFKTKLKEPITIERKIESSIEVAKVELKSKEPINNQIATSFDIFKDEYSLAELLELNITEIPFLVEKLIPKNTLAILAGQSEIGKSTFYTQLAISIVRGDHEFLGRKLSATFNRVLIISTEDGPIPLSFRANRQLKHSTIGVEKSKKLKVIFDYEKLEDKIEKHLKLSPVDLVVIDAFGDVFQGDMNSSSSVRLFLNKYVAIIQKYNCSILFVHHVCKGNKKQKSNKDQLLGSTGIEGKMRNVLMLSIVNDQHQLSIVKGNYIPMEEKKQPAYLNFDNESLTFSIADGPAKPKQQDESAIASGWDSREESKPGRRTDMTLYNQAIQMYKEGMPQVEIAEKTGRDKSTICKWIKKHKESHVYDTSKVGEVD